MTYYFLFGNDACQEYDENGIDGVLERYENNDLDFETFKFVEGETSVIQLLSNFDGWGAYNVITEEEYNKLNL